MSRGRNDIPEQKLLTSGSEASGESGKATAGIPPARQLQELPKDELRALAEEFGLESERYPTPQHLVAALHERRQLIASLDREAMLDVIKWGRRPVPLNATNEQLAQEIAKVRSMSFGGLSHRGLVALARLRGVQARESEDVRSLTKKLKRKEGLLAKLNRKRRSLVGSLVSKIIGDEGESSDYQFLPPQQGAEEGQGTTSAVPGAAGARPSTIKEEIEESGLLGGIAGRIKRSADSYINQKLDEIEARIDRKLDEIDRRLAEWRDKEIANRIRILKITLWASVIVAVVSLLYSYASYLVRLLMQK